MDIASILPRRDVASSTLLPWLKTAQSDPQSGYNRATRSPAPKHYVHMRVEF